MTLVLLLYVYIVIVAGFFLYALLNLYHILRYGRVDAPTYFMTGIFLAGFAFITFVSFSFLSTIDWNRPLLPSIESPFQQNSSINTGF